MLHTMWPVLKLTPVHHKTPGAGYRRKQKKKNSSYFKTIFKTDDVFLMLGPVIHGSFVPIAKKDSHGTDYCLAPSGKMAGQTVEEAHTACSAARKKERQNPRSGSSAHVANASTSSSGATSTPVPSSSSSSDTVFLNGKLYISVKPTWALASVPSSAHITEVLPYDSSLFPYHAFLAFATLAFFASSRSSDAPSGSLLPFILDSGALCHISLFLSDFKSIRPIKPHPIKGLRGQSISALGVGLIELCMPLGFLSFYDALYVPSSGVCLLSIFHLGEAGFTAHFYPRDGHCFVSNSNNSVVAHGSALSECRLFVLSFFEVPFHFHPTFSPSAYFSSHLSDIDSWYKCLDHCSPHMVLDMARSQAVENMRVDLSLPSPKCPHCILRKQTRSSVPKVCEGLQATKQLECVYIDLCGPMSVPSCSGRLYSMNIIDDFSGFVWSIPLRSKAEASVMLKHWLMAMEVQTPHQLVSIRKNLEC